ncbi:MAG TPA: Clp protease N-terminal domain-containing protein [Solirubrobacteraceae bacterium]
MLAGCVAVASAAFALGSQSGDGSAAAARDGGSTENARFVHRGGPGGPGLSALADRLGVSEAKLREALDSLRPSGDPADHEDELAAALAKSLGLDQAKVDAALEQLRAQHEQEHEQRFDEFAAALAKELGLSADKVKAALDKVKPDRPPGPPPPGERPRFRRHDGPRAMLGALAKELGVSRAKLRAALAAVRPDGPGRGGPGHHHRSPGGPGGPLADELADALGVDADEVEQALEDFHQAKRDEFAQKLADKLGIDVAKVKAALPDHP